ncbi:hypothetical protein VNI00_006307 [Paramarasmius palmivorus]|uniref:Uncharacterized protein n=1 Tax=Paramarasmius palmivorus TaxID=297713 RepID=A0AAW0D7I7_9AGAR
MPSTPSRTPTPDYEGAFTEISTDEHWGDTGRPLTEFEIGIKKLHDQRNRVRAGLRDNRLAKIAEQKEAFRAKRMDTEASRQAPTLGEAINATFMANFDALDEANNVGKPISLFTASRNPNVISARLKQMPSGREIIEILDSSDMDQDMKTSFIQGSASKPLTVSAPVHNLVLTKADEERLYEIAEEIEKASEEIRLAGEERSEKLDHILDRLEDGQTGDDECLDLLEEFSHILNGPDVIAEKVKKLVPVVEIPVFRNRRE